MKRKLLLCTAFLLPLLPPPAAFSQGSLSIFVRDAVTGYGTKAGITFQGAKGNQAIETDEGGILLFNSTPGRYDLLVTAKGHKPLQTWFILENGKTLDVEIILDREQYSPPVFENKKGLSVTDGYVVDRYTGKPIGGVDIKITSQKKNIKTNKKGYFYVEIPYFSAMQENDEEPVRADFIFSKQGYKTNIEKDVLLLPGKQTLKITLKKGKGEVVNKHIQGIIEEKEEHQKIHEDEENKPEKVIPPDNQKKGGGHPDNSGQKNAAPGGGNMPLTHCIAPSTIRVGTSCSCASCGGVSVMSLENYVESGLDNEWISSWHFNSLRAGSVAYRTYGTWHVINPINANYDICSSTCCQAYNSNVFASTQNAANFTAGVLLEKNNAVARSEYSAENNNLGVCGWASCSNGGNICTDGFSGSTSYPCNSDAVCTGELCCGHGRGMCQWGSQRWANNNGQAWTWILDHYYNIFNTFRCPGGTPPPVANFTASPTTVCAGSQVSFTDQSTNSPTIWDWSFQGGTPGSSTAQNPTVTYNTAGTFNVTLTATNSGGSDTETKTNYITVNPVTVGGTVSSSATVCSGMNSGILTLSGQVGSVLRWEYSTDGGVTWTNIANTSTTYNYSNITTTTMYRAVVKSGVCPSANSSPATITVDPPTVGGTVQSDATVCSGSNSGTLTLSGHVGSVLRWQYSTDGGVTWTNIINTTTTQAYNNLTTTIPNQQTTIIYRAVVKSGVCPPENSSGATITIDPVTVGGTVAFDATVCKNSNSGTLTLTGQVGIVLNWEYSINGGVTWTNIPNTTVTQGYSNLTTTTMYRAIVKSGVCPSEESFAATIITLDTATVGGTVFGSATVCSGSNIGTLTLTNQVGNVLNWEYSTDGGITWLTIPNTTALQSYNNLTVTTMYRAIVQSGICPDEKSSAATITVDPVTVAGTVSGSATVCSGSNSGTLTLTGQTGNVLRWEYSTDGGLTWVNIANTSATQTYSNLTSTKLYRAVVKSGVCPSSNSTMATVSVDEVSVGGTILSNTVCSGANNGTLFLNGYVENVLQWEYSTDGGITWTIISNTTSSQNYTDVSAVTKYRAIVQNGVCSADTSSVGILFLYPLTVADAGADTAISLGHSITLGGKGGEIYSWSPETGLSDANISAPIATPLETITYIFTVTDKNGCEDTDTITITVLVDYNFIIANLMTPNGDGFNDTWQIGNIENYPGCEVFIYNRYGNLLFNKSKYNNDWDGIYKGSQLPDGTYYYVLKCPEDNVFKGGITILSGE